MAGGRLSARIDGPRRSESFLPVSGDVDEGVEDPLLEFGFASLPQVRASLREGRHPLLIQSAAGGRADVARRSVEHAFRVFSDINGQVPKSQKLVVLSSGGAWPWPAEELRLLSRVAYVGGWDERERIVDFLQGEAVPSDPFLVSWRTSID